MPTSKVCTKCGIDRPLHEFSPDKRGKFGRVSDCKFCRNEYNKKMYPERKKYFATWRIANAEKLKEYNRSYILQPLVKFREYKRAARRRGIPFSLSHGQFVEFWGKPCYYSGHEIPTIGLDRIDSRIGYVAENVVPCCKVCNHAKSNLSPGDFLDMCRLVAMRFPSDKGLVGLRSNF